MTRLPLPAARVDTIGLKCWSGHPSAMGGSHCHSEVELNMVERGSLRYLSGGTQAPVEQGQLAVFWASVPHQIVNAEPNTFMHWLTLPLATFLQWQLPPSLAQPVLQGRVVIGHDEARFASDLSLFNLWREDLEPAQPERRKIALLEIEARLRRLAYSVPSTNASEVAAVSPSRRALVLPGEAELSKVEQMTRFIARRYQEPLQVADIAAAVGLNPNYAMQLFRKEFGMSLGRYLTQFRISHAQRLLAMTDMGVLQVALDSGFASPSRFYAAFRQSCGFSPREYRASLHSRPRP